MRVIAGIAKSLKLKTPEGMDTRPTQDRIKETLFNMIQFELPGSVFVDLYSGSGGIGIEALSRGAEKCYFVDHNQEAMQCIRDNLKTTKLESQAILLKKEVASALLEIKEEHIDFIFMDPPYTLLEEEKIFEKLSTMDSIDSDTTIICEAALTTDFSILECHGFHIVKEKKYKTNMHVFMQREKA